MDTLFNKIYDKIKPTNRLVQNQRKYSSSGQHRIVWIARDGSRNAMQSMPIILECRHRLLHMRAYLAKRNRGQSRFRLNTMDLLSLPEFVIKKGRPHGHRYGMFLADQLKKKCMKKKFKGIHDRFLLDHDFRVRMIENNRDEEVCRRCDVVANEDHIYHQSEEEYFYYKNKW